MGPSRLNVMFPLEFQDPCSFFSQTETVRLAALHNFLLQADFAFVREDASVPALSTLYRDPFKVLEQQDKFWFWSPESGRETRLSNLW